MNTQESSRPMKAYVRDNRRRKITLDLNLNPAVENREAALSGSSQQGGQYVVPPPPPPPPATIDLEEVEEIDDEVVITSPRSFAEARRNKSRRNEEVTVLDEVPPARREEARTRSTLNTYNMRRRPRLNLTIIDGDCINLEARSSAKKKNAAKPPIQIEPSAAEAAPPPPPPPPPPPREPTFTCPVCMGTLVEEVSTKCGHIFCKKCIKASLTAQNKCPTCRRKLTMKDTFRIYLPATAN